MTKKIENIYNEIVDFENIYEATRKAQRNKRYRNDVLKFNAKLEENIIEIQNELIWKTYEPGKYHEFYVYEPRQRLIMALPYKDRVVQWAIYLKTTPLIDEMFYEHSYACRKGKGSLKAIVQLKDWMKEEESIYYGKIDISKFFHRVNHTAIMWDLKNRISDENLLWLYGKFVNDRKTAFGLPRGTSAEECLKNERLFEVGMPIGSLSSQMNANMQLDNLDWYVVKELNFSGHYIRYMDDAILVGKSKKEIWEAIKNIEMFLDKTLQLELNNKTRVGRCTNGVDFLGCKIKRDQIRIKKKSKQRMEKRLKYVRKQYEKKEVTLEKLKETENSYTERLDKFGCVGLMKKLGLSKKEEGMQG